MKDGYGTCCVLSITSVDLVCSIPLSRIVNTSEVKGKGYVVWDRIQVFVRVEHKTKI